MIRCDTVLMGERSSRLSAALFGAASFDEAARLTLRALLELATAQLSASRWAGTGRIMRGIVHFRPADGYRRLLAVDVQPGERAIAGAIVPSVSAWRWVAEHRGPVAVDINRATVKLCVDGQFVSAPRRATAPITQESSILLLAREASHLLLIPLRAPGNTIDGMMSIEANCLPADDCAFIWPGLVAEAQLYADIAAPHLAALPTEARPVAATDPYLPVIGASMSSLVEMLRIFAEQDETVLLTGPTGAGKSRLARWCHHRSRRANGPFEILELATVPEDLQLAELFGWKRGAFTSASRDTAGAVTRAEGGTLFIDEIDKLSLRAQAGLLRVFEERRYRPLGEGVSDRPANVRFIVGTNANVRELVKSGEFREDLYYRINVLPVAVPSLAERRDEIPAWALYMLRRRHETGRGSAERGEAAPGEVSITPDAIERMRSHAWPGNLRQLDNIVRRAYTLSLLEAGGARDVTLTAAHLERAFSLEGRQEGLPLLELMAMAAEAFVDEAQRGEGAGGAGASASALKLDHADAWRGLILAVAARRLRSKEDAFRLFGKEAAVTSRNHHKVLRTELARLAALREALGQPPDPELDALLGSSGEG